MNYIEQFRQYLREVRIETKKVTYPTRKDTIATTWVVIAVVILISIYLAVADFGLSKLVGMVLT